MRSSKKKEIKGKGVIRGNHKKINGPIFVYLIVFVSVSIVMIALNQTRKGNILKEQTARSTNMQDSSTRFNKEGELTFIGQKGETITSIDIEIADDDIQTQRGLMYRRKMKEDRGMLFIFRDVEERSFWMKNTYLSLDIMYLGANKEIVSITENTPPKSEESIWSEYPAKYVVEVNAGFVSQHQIQVGDKIEFKRVFN